MMSKSAARRHRNLLLPGDIPEPHLVAAALVLVRVGEIDTGDGHARERTRDLPLARRRCSCRRSERKDEREREDPEHRRGR